MFTTPSVAQCCVFILVWVRYWFKCMAKQIGNTYLFFKSVMAVLNVLVDYAECNIQIIIWIS